MKPRITVRHFLLLEVVIALMLVALTVIPLLAPQAYILYRQKTFMQEVDLDHLVNLLYADVVVHLYKGQIPWTDIINSTEFEVDDTQLKQVGFDKQLNFKGTYKFTKEKQKPKKESPYTIYLFNLDFHFSPKDAKASKKTFDYHYNLFLLRYLEEGGTEIQESDLEQPEERR